MTESDTEASGRSDSPTERTRQEVDESLGHLQQGRQVSLGEGGVPVRSMAAVGIFVAVFAVSYLLCWAVLGGLGFIVGFIVGGALGAFAVKLYADRAAGAG